LLALHFGGLPGLRRCGLGSWAAGRCRGLEDPADVAGGAGGDALAVRLDGGRLQAVEVAQQAAPFDGELGVAAEIGQRLLQQQGQRILSPKFLIGIGGRREAPYPDQ
jgi:hypothetical protein